MEWKTSTASDSSDKKSRLVHQILVEMDINIRQGPSYSLVWALSVWEGVTVGFDIF